jgi:CheY-like chemotaxis protein
MVELQLRGVRVLIVDDDEDTRALFALALGEAGADVRLAADGTEAKNQAVAWCPSVIISDLVMPDTDAPTLLCELRAMHPAATIPSIAVSGRSSTKDRDEAVNSGFQEHAAKPIIPHDLVGIVKRLAR